MNIYIKRLYQIIYISMLYVALSGLAGAAQPSFKVIVPISQKEVIQGGYATFDVIIEPLNGWNTPVWLRIYELPPHISAYFNPNNVIPTGSSRLTVLTSTLTALGDYRLTIVGEGQIICGNDICMDAETTDIILKVQGTIGDIDGDKQITASDALLYLRYAVGQSIFPYYISNSDDVTCDGAIHADDALKVLRKAVGQNVNLYTC